MFSYVAITTKIKGMRKNLWGPEEFHELKQLHSLESINQFIQDTKGYDGVLDTQNLLRTSIERQIEQSYLLDFVKLYRFATIDQRKILKNYALMDAANVIKRAFKQINGFVEVQVEINDFTDFLERSFNFHLQELLFATSPDQVVEALRDSPFKPFFDHLDMDIQSLHSLDSQYQFEMALDHYVTRLAWSRMLRSLPFKLQSKYRKSNGVEIDLINIAAIYRLKFYYQRSASEIWKQLLPLTHKVNNDVIQELMAATDNASFFAILQRIGYDQLFTDNFQVNDWADLEEAYLAKVQRQIAKQTPRSIFTIIEYLAEKKQEGEEIIQLIEYQTHHLSTGGPN